MNELDSMLWILVMGGLLGAIATGILIGLAVLISPQKIGFKTEKFRIQKRWFTLLEISAAQRLAYLSRCGNFDINNGFELMRRDLSISSDLIALHQRRWYLPHWYLMWQIQRLPGETIYTLFKHCVKLSNIPFDIEDKAEETAEDKAEEAAEEEAEDDWDYIDEEKKRHPAVPPKALATR